MDTFFKETESLFSKDLICEYLTKRELFASIVHHNTFIDPKDPVSWLLEVQELLADLNVEIIGRLDPHRENLLDHNI